MIALVHLYVCKNMFMCAYVHVSMCNARTYMHIKLNIHLNIHSTKYTCMKIYLKSRYQYPQKIEPCAAVKVNYKFFTATGCG